MIGNSEKIDFTDFLADIGFIGRKELEELINRFDNNLDAREKLEKYYQKI